MSAETNKFQPPLEIKQPTKRIEDLFDKGGEQDEKSLDSIEHELGNIFTNLQSISNQNLTNLPQCLYM